MKFTANSNRASFGGFNLGAAASYNQGDFFAEALVKHDFISGKLKDPAQGAFQGELNGKAYGGRLQVGYRLGSDKLSVQPHGSIESQRTELDDFQINM